MTHSSLSVPEALSSEMKRLLKTSWRNALPASFIYDDNASGTLRELVRPNVTTGYRPVANIHAIFHES